MRLVRLAVSERQAHQIAEYSLRSRRVSPRSGTHFGHTARYSAVSGGKSGPCTRALPVVSARGETGVLGDAFKQAWRNFVGFMAGIISFTGILIPLAAIGFLVWLAWRRWGPDQLPPPRKGVTPPATGNSPSQKP